MYYAYNTYSGVAISSEPPDSTNYIEIQELPDGDGIFVINDNKLIRLSKKDVYNSPSIIDILAERQSFLADCIIETAVLETASV